MDCERGELGPMPAAYREILVAAEALLTKIEERMARRVRPTGRLRKTKDVLLASAELVQKYTDHVEGLSVGIEDLNFALFRVAQEEAAISEAMAVMEKRVNNVLLRYHRIKGLRTDRLGGEGRDLLVAIYGHLLGEVRVWLVATVQVLRDPLDALERQGELIEPPVAKLEVVSHFAMPPQFDDLEAWAKRCLAGG